MGRARKADTFGNAAFRAVYPLPGGQSIDQVHLVQGCGCDGVRGACEQRAGFLESRCFGGHHGRPRSSAMPIELVELPMTEERRCPACQSKHIKRAGHFIAGNGTITSQH